jgi:hypothetical protein
VKEDTGNMFMSTVTDLGFSREYFGWLNGQELPLVTVTVC